MLYQDKVLKENWTFKRGELYMIDHKRGQRPRQSSIEVSVVLWPKEQTPTTKKFFVAPITLDVTGRDEDMDVIIRDKRDIGKPFAVTLMDSHVVNDSQLLSYVGKLNERTTNRIVKKMQEVLIEYCEFKEAS